MRGLELALAGELDQLAHIGAAISGWASVSAADPHADRFDTLDQQIVGARRAGAAAEKAEDQDAAAPGETAQRFLETSAVDRVVDDIDAARAPVSSMTWSRNPSR